MIKDQPSSDKKMRVDVAGQLRTIDLQPLSSGVVFKGTRSATDRPCESARAQSSMSDSRLPGIQNIESHHVSKTQLQVAQEVMQHYQ